MSGASHEEIKKAKDPVDILVEGLPNPAPTARLLRQHPRRLLATHEKNIPCPQDHRVRDEVRDRVAIGFPVCWSAP